MAKLLAALELPQVGEIKLLDSNHPDDGSSCTSFCSFLNHGTRSRKDGRAFLHRSKRSRIHAQGWSTKKPCCVLFKCSLQASKREDAEMWVAKLNQLKKTKPAGSGASKRSSPNPSSQELGSSAGGGNSDPNEWAKNKKRGCFGIC